MPEVDKGSRSWRNNNPGNIEYGNFAKSQGAIGSDGRFAIFPTEQAGTQAHVALLSKPRYLGQTLAKAVETWAPGFENNVKAYVGSVSKALGVDPNTPMSQINLDAMSAAMRRHEGWRPGVSKAPGAVSAFSPVTSSTPPTSVPPTSAPPSTQPTSFASLLAGIQNGAQIVQHQGQTYYIPPASAPAPVQSTSASTPPTGTIQPKTVTGPPNWAQILLKRRVDGNEKVDFNPTLGTGLAALFQDRPELKLDSGTRDAAQQKRLWDNALIKYGTVAEARRWVAPPGRSKHENKGVGGDAADVKGLPSNRTEAQALLGRYGLTLPLSNEGWHVELIGSRKKK